MATPPNWGGRPGEWVSQEGEQGGVDLVGVSPQQPVRGTVDLLCRA
ncbi:hypothetical protein [Streptomyces sp. NRRL F-5650]|nr:hypothetical protein [Streptomyces sp. NRRL F-5650]